MKKGYPYIDMMRIFAAIFVVAIHIAPFAQINPTLDIVVTRIIGRLAVPFFFITTSFFLFQDGYPSVQRIQKTFKQLLQWYLIASIIYIPLMFYNDYFHQDYLFIELMKDIFIDGMFYHLWYFPAVMIGLIIVLIIEKYCPKYSLLVVIFLYAIGLCGDSYYYFITQVSFFKSLYTFLFQFMDYTRNGFFFAPLFVMIGVIFSKQKRHFKRFISFLLFLLSLILMTIEASFVHSLSLFKHDSMYLLLSVVSYFLFAVLISYRGQRIPQYQTISLCVYIIHPLMIVIVRMIGKVMKWTLLINDNSIQFICVIFLSFLIAWFMSYFMKGKHHERTSI